MKNSATSKPKEPRAAGNSAPWTSWIAGDGSHSFDDSVQQPSPAQVKRAGFTRRRGSSSSRSTVRDGHALDGPTRSPSTASKDEARPSEEKKRDFYRRRTSTLATQGTLDRSERPTTASDPGPAPENPKVLRKGSSSFDQFFSRVPSKRPSWLVNRKLSKRITSDRDSEESRSTSRSGSRLDLFDVALDEAYAASTARDLPEIDDGFEMATFDVAALTDVSERPVGVGCQGTVWSCQVPEGKFSGRRLALKVLRGDLAEDETECQSFVREALLLGRMKHAHVLRALGCAETSAGLPCLLLAWVETDATRALRLDEVGGSTTARAEVRKAWPSLERLRLLRELALALEFLHSGDAIAGGVAVVHRDLKPDNLGIDSSRRLKLLDFGLAVALDVDNNNTDATYELTGATGSRRYMAPEVCRRDFYGTKVDVYSWAIAALEIWSLAGKPYRRHDIKSHFAHVVRARERPVVPAVWNADLRGLLAEAWADDQGKRPPAGDAAGVLTRVDAMCHQTVPPVDPLQGGLPKSPVSSLRKLWSFQKKKSADERPGADEKTSKRRLPKFF